MRRVSFLGLVALIATLMPIAPAHALTHLVQVKGGAFQPASIAIAVGDTVQWNALEMGHTVSAADYRFDFWPDRTLKTGDSVSWTFTEDETVRYLCRIHGPGMAGVIRVGEGSPPPPPPPVITGESRRVPSQYPTINAALAEIVPDSEIILEPGIYEPFTVDVDQLLIRGATESETANPGPVIIDGANIAKTGVVIKGDAVTLREVEIRKVADRAIQISGDDVAIEYVTLQSGLVEGISADSVKRMRVDGVTIASSPGATGIRVVDPNSLLVASSVIAGGKAGIVARRGGGVVIRNTAIGGSGTGIMLRGDPGQPVVGAHIFSNDISSTQNPLGAPESNLELVSGAAVWLDSTFSATVQGNRIKDALTYGIAATGIWGPNLDLRSIGNEIVDFGVAAEGWDGLGTACTTSPSTEPSTMSTTNACGSPRAGLPYPKVTAELAQHAMFGNSLKSSIPQLP